jgi:Pentapeptide repeats (8 copies)
MAKQEHLDVLKRGTEPWNQWRADHPEIHPHLAEADLHGLNLREANLSRADLYWATLNETDLSGADLRNADLGGADLSRANLSGADLSGADLRGANAFKANLRGANLSGARLLGVTLLGTGLSSTNLTDPPLLEPRQDSRDITHPIEPNQELPSLADTMPPLLATTPSEDLVLQEPLASDQTPVSQARRRFLLTPFRVGLILALTILGGLLGVMAANMSGSIVGGLLGIAIALLLLWRQQSHNKTS